MQSNTSKKKYYISSRSPNQFLITKVQSPQQKMQLYSPKNLSKIVNQPTLQREQFNYYKINPNLRNKISNNSKIIFKYETAVSFNNYVDSISNQITFSKKCGICLIQANAGEKAFKCEHQYCTNCLTQYIKYKVSVNQDIQCPDETCFSCFNQQGQFFMQLPKQIINKYQRNKTWKQNINSTNVRLCPQQKCNQGVIDLRLTPPKCGSCGMTLCVNCEMESHQGLCDQNFQKIFTQWKRCPNCHIFIQKSQGCNHMTCRCRYQFCFKCLDPWTNRHHHCGFHRIIQFYEPQPPTPRCVTQNNCLKKIIFCLAMLLFPLLILIGIILTCIILLISLALGLVIGPFYLLLQILRYNQTKYHYLEIITIFLLIYPVVIIGCGVYSVIYVVEQLIIPKIREIDLEYYRWVSNLWTNQ